MSSVVVVLGAQAINHTSGDVFKGFHLDSDYIRSVSKVKVSKWRTMSAVASVAVLSVNMFVP